MKRDIDLVRKILLAIEDLTRPSVPSDELNIDGYSKSEISYHVYLLMQAELVTGEGIITDHHEIFTGTFVSASATSLTWDGHEFLDAAREDSRWDEAKKVAAHVGGVTFKTMLDVILARLANVAAAAAMR